jgi:signal transduction histidine kinase
MIYGGQMETGRALINAVLALFVAATFQPLKVKLEKATNRIFYKGGYDSDELAGSITAVMAETFKLEELATQSLEKLVNTMNITNGTFWVIDKETFTNVACAGHKTPPRYQHDDLMKLSQSDHLMVFEEDTDSHQGVLRHMNITVAMPLFAGEVLQGLILLGPKKSGDVYTDKDLNLLRILGPSLATALENARSYRQISEFNITLRDEVEKATEQLRQANDQLTRKNRQLQELDKLKDEFISVTSHELRTPLTAIRGYLWMVLNNRDQASFKTYLDRAYVSSERLIDLDNDTLDISRIESGRVQLDPQPTKLPTLARQVATELEPKAKERNQKLIVRQSPNLPAAYCDTDKVHQVMTNLIGNSLKFTPEHGTISVHFYVDG